LRNNYVLIDYENVQPASLSGLEAETFHVYLFLGQNQAKLSYDVASAMQKLGDRGTYVKISGNGPNALDFHIAYYIGALSAKEPDASFHIISKDAGFDPLISHLKDLKVAALRSKAIADIPLLKATNAQSMPEKIKLIVVNLRQRGISKPRSVKTLSSTIASLFQKQLDEQELASIMAELQKRQLITISGAKVSYVFPDVA
jgi:hypothetical protein